MGAQQVLLSGVLAYVSCFKHEETAWHEIIVDELLQFRGIPRARIFDISLHPKPHKS